MLGRLQLKVLPGLDIKALRSDAACALTRAAASFSMLSAELAGEGSNVH